MPRLSGGIFSSKAPSHQDDRFRLSKLRGQPRHARTEKSSPGSGHPEASGALSTEKLHGASQSIMKRNRRSPSKHILHESRIDHAPLLFAPFRRTMFFFAFPPDDSVEHRE